MSGCKFPQHHQSGRSPALLALAVLFAAALLSRALREAAHVVSAAAHVFVLAVLPGLVLTAAVFLLARRAHGFRLPRFTLPRLPRFSARWLRYLPAAVRAAARWSWLMRNLGAAYPDRHRKGKVRSPRAWIFPTGHGITARVRTVPGTGRAELERHAQDLADAWHCHRVQVSQRKPGKLTIRGLRTDPLTLPLAAPPGLYGPCVTASNENGRARRPARSESVTMGDTFRLFLGRDEFGADRWLPLAGVTGITVGGLPGYGKTSLVRSWLMQLAGLEAVQFVLIDGKGGGDYSEWEDRAFISTGDELPAAAAALEDTHALMRTRLAVVGEGGLRNRWHVGPAPAWPLVVTVVDECHTFFDLDAVKGNKDAEAHARACRALTGQLVKKGRSPLFVTILLTQKQTSDAVPTAIRDNCRFGMSFAVKTRDAAVAALGEQIREYPSYCPTTLQDPAYIGVATASLRTGQDPFVRIKVPEVSDAASAARAAETACKRSDPRLTPEALADPVLSRL